MSLSFSDCLGERRFKGFSCCDRARDLAVVRTLPAASAQILRLSINWKRRSGWHDRHLHRCTPPFINHILTLNILLVLTYTLHAAAIVFVRPSVCLSVTLTRDLSVSMNGSSCFFKRNLTLRCVITEFRSTPPQKERPFPQKVALRSGTSLSFGFLVLPELSNQ